MENKVINVDITQIQVLGEPAFMAVYYRKLVLAKIIKEEFKKWLMNLTN